MSSKSDNKLSRTLYPEVVLFKLNYAYCVGEDQILESLKRLVSGVLTHPVTIGKMIDQHTPKRKKNTPKTVHLVGTDRPEATMIYAGFYHEILASNPNNPIKLTLVSPDEANHQLSQDCSPASPMLINPR